MNITQVYEKVKIKDIFASLKEIFAGNKNDINQGILEQKLQEIYKVEFELGATDSISALEKDVENHTTTDRKIKSRKTSKMSTNIITTEIKNKEIEENISNHENNLDR